MSALKSFDTVLIAYIAQSINWNYKSPPRYSRLYGKGKRTNENVEYARYLYQDNFWIRELAFTKDYKHMHLIVDG